MSEKGETVKTAFIEALPLAIAIAAYGLSYGVLASQAKVSLAETVSMSLLVFSGSVQMVTVAMLASGAGFASIFVSSVLLNLRNLLYGAALSEGIASSKWKWILSIGVSDEPFVLGSSRFKKYGPDPLYFGVVVGTFYIAWALSSFLGAVIGNQIDPLKYGLDLAFPVTFTALLIPGIKEKPVIAAAVIAAVLAVGLEYFFPGNELTIIITGIAAPFAGLYINRRS